MESLRIKAHILAISFMLICCLGINASDEDLTTEQVTVYLSKAGTLFEKIDSSKKYRITNLKIIGEINGTDISFIRDMAIQDKTSTTTTDGGNLSILDLSESKIVSGGDNIYYTTNNEIGEYMFKDCSGLTSINLPSGITSIGYGAFEYCNNLTSVNIQEGVTSIGHSAFNGCNVLTSINIPEGVTSIGEYAFTSCNELKEIDLPSSLTSIGFAAFEDCGLIYIKIPENVTYLPHQVFSYSDLASIDIPSSVTQIGMHAFDGCNLQSIGIPSSVSSIDERAFHNCTILTSIWVYWNNPISITDNVFDGVDKQRCTLHVPQGTYSKYKEADVWGDFCIVEHAQTGINNPTTKEDAQETARYSVSGQRLNTPTKGFNIVKYDNGVVKKVVVK